MGVYNMPTAEGTFYNTNSPAARYLFQDFANAEANDASYQNYLQNTQSDSVSNAMVRSAEAQAQAATAAAQIQADAASEALGWQREQYAEGKEAIEGAVGGATDLLTPWRDAGVDALGQLTEKIAAGPGEYTQSEGYDVRLAEGEKAIGRTAAARGGALSGRAVKEATRYGQNYATNDYDNFLNRYYASLEPLERMSGVGANTSQQMGNYMMQGATNIANTGQNAVNQMTQTSLYGGEATAGGIMNAANIYAAQQTAAAERDYSYNMWKSGGYS